MVGFFRLGKSAKEEPTEGPQDALLAGGGGGGGAVASSGPPVLQEGGKEKEKKSKKSKETGLEQANSPTGAGAGDVRTAAASSARAQTGLSVNDFISKTKSQQRQGLKPSGPELIAYARYLGIDPVADHDLLWIAVEALEAPLPSDWTEHFDSNDRVFYYNATTRVSSWTHPLEHKYRETYKTIINFRNASLSAPERAEKLHQLQAEVEQMERDVHKEIAQWTEHTDEQGNRFYFNREERGSTWTDPRPAKCQVLYLRMKMLKLLQSSAGATAGFHDQKADKLAHYSTMGGMMQDDESAHKRSRQEDTHRPVDPMSDQHDTDTDSCGDDRKAKKDKKKKKKKKKDKESAPIRLGAPQKLGNSQSEPSVGGGESQSARGRNGGAAAAASSMGGPSGGGGAGMPSLGALDDGGMAGAAGRSRVKAGIRLQPIGPGSPPPEQLGNSASVPTL